MQCCSVVHRRHPSGRRDMQGTYASACIRGLQAFAFRTARYYLVTQQYSYPRVRLAFNSGA